MATSFVNTSGVQVCTGLSASESTDALRLRTTGGALGSVQVVSGGGTGFNSGTVTIQASNDGTNWITLQSPLGDTLAFTGDGGAEISTGFAYVRATADASISDVDVMFHFRG